MEHVLGEAVVSWDDWQHRVSWQVIVHKAPGQTNTAAGTKEVGSRIKFVFVVTDGDKRRGTRSVAIMLEAGKHLLWGKLQVRADAIEHLLVGLVEDNVIKEIELIAPEFFDLIAHRAGHKLVNGHAVHVILIIGAPHVPAGTNRQYVLFTAMPRVLKARKIE